jgi:hypothetical protein
MANNEHVRILKLGVDVWNKWRKDNPDIEPDLSKAKISGDNLEKANLKNADLSGADLKEANIYKADLSGANLIGADLRGGVLPICLGNDELMAHAERINKTHLVCDLKNHGVPSVTLDGILYQLKPVTPASLDDADLYGTILDSDVDLLAVPWSRLKLGKDVYQRIAVERGHEILPVGMGKRLRELGVERVQM